MSQIHYFQRYDQKENWATNSTLLLLSRLYHYNQLKFQQALNQLLDEEKIELGIGVNFSQQERGTSAVADGVIEQPSFKLLIETKLYDNFDVGQLKRHIDGLRSNHQTKVLLALSKNKVSTDTRSRVHDYLKQEKVDNIKFASASFQDLIKVIESALSDNDIEMKEILNDYYGVCELEGLIDYKNETLLVFTANESLKENLKYNIYYDGADRSHNQPFRFVGLYVNKEVVAVGELQKTVYCDLKDGKLVSQSKEPLNITPGEAERIKSIIENTKYYNLHKGIKFMLVDKFQKTHFKKVSPRPVRMKRYFYLSEVDNNFDPAMGAKKVADYLNGKNWE